ncbi:MAG: heavy metal-binding domain-containing protein [Polyangiales bacterium]
MRLTVSLATNPLRQQWTLYREWQAWARRAGFPQLSFNLAANWPQWGTVAAAQWSAWCTQMNWTPEPLAPWARPRARAAYALGQNVAEFVAIGTAVRHRDGEHYRNALGKPFQSDLNGQDFWTLIRCGFRPVGFVMGNCVYYVPPHLLQAPQGESCELTAYTHALYDARELATERLQDEAEVLQATGIVGVTFAERQHSWRPSPYNIGNAALDTGEVIELFVVGTAVVPHSAGGGVARPMLVLSANDLTSTTEASE